MKGKLKLFSILLLLVPSSCSRLEGEIKRKTYIPASTYTSYHAMPITTYSGMHLHRSTIHPHYTTTYMPMPMTHYIPEQHLLTLETLDKEKIRIKSINVGSDLYAAANEGDWFITCKDRDEFNLLVDFSKSIDKVVGEKIKLKD